MVKNMDQKEIAKERIIRLFEQAEKIAKSDLSKANRYVELARKISMKTKTSIPLELKRRFCSHCHSYFSNGNYRIRTRDKKIIYYCLKCKKHKRVGLSKRS